MKKQFSVNVDNKAPARQVEAIKYEIKKYMAREKRKDLPEGFDFWDFDCLMGATQEGATEVHSSKINTTIDQLVADGKEEFFVSVLAKPRKRQSKKG